MLEHGMMATTDSGGGADIFGDGSCVAFYKLDGNANDELGNYNGIENAITYDTGKFGQGAVFNGSSSYINTGYSPTNYISCSAWMKLSTQAYNGYDIFVAGTSDGNDFRVLMYGYGEIYFDTGGGVYTFFPYTPVMDTWVHIVAVNNNGVRSIYINGTALSRTTDVLGSSAPYGSTLRIGKGWSVWYGCNAVMDNIRIFNRAITASEATTLFTEGA